MSMWLTFTVAVKALRRNAMRDGAHRARHDHRCCRRHRHGGHRQRRAGVDREPDSKRRDQHRHDQCRVEPLRPGPHGQRQHADPGTRRCRGNCSRHPRCAVRLARRQHAPAGDRRVVELETRKSKVPAPTCRSFARGRSSTARSLPNWTSSAPPRSLCSARSCAMSCSVRAPIRPAPASGSRTSRSASSAFLPARASR